MERTGFLLNKYSSELTLTENGNTKIIKGIIQPFHYKDKSYFTPKRYPSGLFDGRHYLLISSPEYKNDIYRGLIIESDGKSYFVKSVETYRVENKDYYVWAVLTAHTDSKGEVYE